MPNHKNVSRRGTFKSRTQGMGLAHKSVVPLIKFTTITANPNVFTLQDEASSTSKNRKKQNSDRKLRNDKVIFVSAGYLGNNRPIDTVKSSKETTLEFEAKSKDLVIHNYQNSANEVDSQSQQVSTEMKDFEGLVIEYQSGEPIKAKLSSPHIRPTSPTPSDSSEEVILFTGRNVPKAPINTTIEKSFRLIERNSVVFEDQTHKYEDPIGEGSLGFSKLSGEILSPNPVSNICAKLKNAQLSPPHRNSNYVNVKKNMLNESIADYLSNVDPQDERALTLFSRRDLGGSLDSDIQKVDSPVDSVDRKSLFGHSCNAHNKYDPEAINTSDSNVIRTRKKSPRSDQGPKTDFVDQQAHLTREASSISFIGPINTSAFLDVQEIEAQPLGKFELEPSNIDDSDSSESLECSDSLTNCFLKPHNTEIDGSVKKKKNQVEDGGFGTSSDDEVTMDDIQLTCFLRNNINPFSSKKNKKNKKKSKKKGLAKAKRNAIAFDQYYDEHDIFDIMDFDRPCLSKRKAAANFSDPRIDEYMKMAQQNNRLKKQEKKKEREVLRSLGLLGCKSGKSDLRIKYINGMSFDELKKELKTFLMSDSSSLILPPMDKADRQVIHKVANMLKLKSKSSGDGFNRFPILYRTSRTTHFDEDIFQAIETPFERGFLPGSNRKAKKNSRNKGPGKASYRDGEIVGGSAPELGAENRGRAMLEKMGWSSGTALGAINNKGILQPLPHIVRKKKECLGSRRKLK